MARATTRTTVDVANAEEAPDIARVREILAAVKPLAAEYYRLTGKPLGVKLSFCGASAVGVVDAEAPPASPNVRPAVPSAHAAPLVARFRFEACFSSGIVASSALKDCFRSQPVQRYAASGSRTTVRVCLASVQIDE